MFSSDWLSIREPLDHQTFAVAPLTRLTDWLAANESGNDSPISLTDLGSGTGSQLRFLAPRLPYRQHWTLVERDERLINMGKRRLDAWLQAPGAAHSVTFEYSQLDIDAELDAVVMPARSIITAAALLDLVSQRWLEALASRVADSVCALYVRLSVNGDLAFSPKHADDVGVISAFAEDQQQEKGFGKALGHDAVPVLAERLERHGYRCAIVRANWAVDARHPELARQLVSDYARIAAAKGLDVAAWQAVRTAEVEEGTFQHRVGHFDVLALPPDTNRTPR